MSVDVGVFIAAFGGGLVGLLIVGVVDRYMFRGRK